MSTLVRACNIGIFRNRQWLIRGLNLTIGQGQIVTLIGANGSGKSTIAKLVLGLFPPDAGTIWRAPALSVGYLPQRLNLTPSLPMTATGLINLTAFHSHSAVKAALAAVGMAQHERTSLTALSGGELQRILLARILISQPQILVLDEPAQGVDAAGVLTLYRLIKEIRERTSCGILLISHDSHILPNLATKDTDAIICLGDDPA